MGKFNIDKYLSDDDQTLVSADLFRILGFVDWDDTSQNDCIKFGMLKACELIASEIHSKHQTTVYSKEVLDFIHELQGIDPEIKAIAQGIRGIK